ncbi:MAG: putative fructose-bisphosphate aldolase [Gemmatimonadetes bacterium]|nr:putative fructose-bisphosphate aldolase [Gemmatimonadota bacterium]
MPDPIDRLNSLFGSAVSVAGSRVTVKDRTALAGPAMDQLVRAAVFGGEEEKHYARWLIWEIGQGVGVRASSIQDLYVARGRGEISGFTVPAINVRGMAYDTARSIFRTGIRMQAGAFILEIARSEIAYTEQRPSEYVAVMIAAALREGWLAPVFIQGDHFQVNAKKYAADKEAEVEAVKHLAREAVHAGFYNIDVDTSTLVDISKPNLDEQQRLNYEVGTELVTYVRSLEPKDVTISIGGEIGEVGTENSTVEELRAYMDGLNRSLPKGMIGLSKISVQSGTSHGGTVLADGSIADVKLDLDTLERLSKVARDEYGLAGAVQHGASTLTDDAFHNFPKRETAEIHLATNFQNMLYDHLPPELRQEMYAWLDVNAKDERKEKDSPEQFYYKTRKKAIGPFKQKLWSLPADTQVAVDRAYDEKFGFLFEQLGLRGTAEHVAKYVRAPEQHRPMPSDAHPAMAAAPDDPDAGE